MDYKKLNSVHRAMMALFKKITIGKKTYEELTEEERLLYDTYGKKVDFTDKQSIQPIVDYVNEIPNREKL